MPRSALVAVALLISATSTAQAGHPLALGQHCGRWIGYGWSEGYHAYDACPTCRRGHSKNGAYLHWQPLPPDPLPLPVPSVLPLETLPPPVPQAENARPRETVQRRTQSLSDSLAAPLRRKPETVER